LSRSGTVIIPFRSAKPTDALFPSDVVVALIEAQGKSLRYRDALVFPALIVTWCVFAMTLLSFLLAALAARHIHRYGPENSALHPSVRRVILLTLSCAALMNHHATDAHREKHADDHLHDKHSVTHNGSSTTTASSRAV
jgi:hypothetical protein